MKTQAPVPAAETIGAAGGTISNPRWEAIAMHVLLTQMPVVHAAIEYSMLYMLFGGGIVGAVVVYGLARAFNR